MIVRIWRAKANSEGAQGYRQHFEGNVLPELKSLAGFLKAYLLTRDRDGTVDIEVHTLWQSLEAIRAFAGPDLEAAVVEPHAQAVLTSYDTTVTHFAATEYLA
jgi:heme-degrading monooxygenase HmoA